MRYWIKALGALAMMVCGCNPIVLDPIHSDTSGISDPGDEPAEPSAVAMRFSEWQIPPNDGSPFNPQVTIAVPPEPDALVLFLASQAQACAQPVIQFDPGTDPAVCAAQAFWQAILVIPPDRLIPGATIDLDAPDIYVYQAVWKSSCGGGSGGGPGAQGTLEIVSIDATEVSVKLNLDQQQPSGWETQNGDYTAPFCP